MMFSRWVTSLNNLVALFLLRSFSALFFSASTFSRYWTRAASSSKTVWNK